LVGFTSGDGASVYTLAELRAHLNVAIPMKEFERLMPWLIKTYSLTDRVLRPAS
jgi:hypothetical protein